jgi:hypothetical protein
LSEDRSGAGEHSRQRRVAELERRIAAMEARDDADFGAFTARDWWICAIFGLAGPAAALWWFAG